jgi:hypothetical protein
MRIAATTAITATEARNRVNAGSLAPAPATTARRIRSRSPAPGIGS